MTENSPVKEEKKEPAKMGLLDHLEELRWRLAKTFIVFGAIVVVLFVFIQFAADVLYYPLSRVNSGIADQNVDLYAGGPMTVFSVFLQIGIFGGAVFTLPVALYQLSRFIAPGLNERELKLIRPVCVAGLILFLVGASFAYFILVPLTLEVSVFLSQMFNWTLLWTADKYYGLLIWMTFGIGLAFEFPLILVCAIYLEIVNTQQLIRAWRWMLVVFLIVGALITPTADPFAQLALSIPLFLMYLLAIWIGKRIEKKRRLALDDVEEEWDTPAN